MYGPKTQRSTELARLPDSSLGSHEPKRFTFKGEQGEIVLPNEWRSAALG